VVGLRDDAAIIPAGSPALEGVTSPCYPTRCKEKGSKRTFNKPTMKCCAGVVRRRLWRGCPGNHHVQLSPGSLCHVHG